MSETLESKIREMNREILRLKTSHPMASGMKTFWAEYTLELEEAQDNRSKSYYFEITYVEGYQPILSELMANINSNIWAGMMVLESPSNNKQILAVWGTGYGNIIEIVISSSRQILGIRRVNTPA